MEHDTPTLSVIRYKKGDDMTPENKLACCAICLLAEKMKVCKVCKFNPENIKKAGTK